MRKLLTQILLILTCFLLVFSIRSLAQSNSSQKLVTQSNSTLKSIAKSNSSLRVVFSKNYYFLSLLDSANSSLKNILARDPVLQQISRNKADSLAARAKGCGRQRACFVDLMHFSEDEITQIGERIEALWAKGNELDQLLK